MNYIHISKLNTFLLLKKSKKEVSKKFMNKMEAYLYYSQNINRSYVKCPYCNSTNFRKIHCYCKDDKTEKLTIQIGNKKIKLGNNVMVIKRKDNKKIYRVNDFVFHLIKEHSYIPRKWFENLVLEGCEPNTSDY